MNSTQRKEDNFEEISGRPVQVTSDYFAKLARKNDKVFVLLQDIDEAFDNSGKFEAEKEVEEWDSSQVRPVGEELAEEME